jgi:hypothetical protein
MHLRTCLHALFVKHFFMINGNNSMYNQPIAYLKLVLEVKIVSTLMPEPEIMVRHQVCSDHITVFFQPNTKLVRHFVEEWVNHLR